MASAARRFSEESQLRARLLGVIEEYLRTATASSAAARGELADRVRMLTEELAAVEQGTDRSTIDEELEARLGAMSVDMTAWARELELEASESGNVYIDRRTLNVAIGTGHSLNGSLQVIITDHATFVGEPWFDDALIEDWHSGTKLVPETWPEN